MDNADLESIQEQFRACLMSLRWDPSTAQAVIEAYPLDEVDEDDGDVHTCASPEPQWPTNRLRTRSRSETFPTGGWYTGKRSLPGDGGAALDHRAMHQAAERAARGGYGPAVGRRRTRCRARWICCQRTAYRKSAGKRSTRGRMKRRNSLPSFMRKPVLRRIAAFDVLVNNAD